MAVVEDAASVLDQFVQDVANLPAEIAHLLEEIEAKDKIIADSRTVIHTRDISIQKFCKANGSGQANPKEESYIKTVLQNFDRCQTLQEEKVALSDKARVLLDRQVKKLDYQIRALEGSSIIVPDPSVPSLLYPSPANRLPPLSNTTTGTSTPLHPTSANVNPHSTLPSHPQAHAAIARLVTSQLPQSNTRHASPVASPNTASPTGTGANLPRTQREGSTGLDAKRRRLALNMPSTSSGLRQSSLGPTSTLKPGTPVARAGSVGPRASSGLKKGGIPAKSQLNPSTANRLTPNPIAKKGPSARPRKGNAGRKGIKASLSDTGDDSALSEVGDSESENKSNVGASAKGRKGHGTKDGQGHDEDVEMGGMKEEDEEEGDDKEEYCTCRSVSYGNMVACDNEKCPYEWFHWSCVGITKEPVGKWYCEECTTKLNIK